MMPITVLTPLHHGTVSGPTQGLAMDDIHDAESLRADFDRLAGLSEDGWDHNAHYHGFLLAQLPPGCRQALDVGCGTGAFARLLAGRCDRVLGIDLAPRMVEVARARSGGHPNLDYQVADASSWPFPPVRFDCVASIAAAHHLPLAPLLRKMGEAVIPGGTLLVLDIYRPRSPADLAVSLLAVPGSRLLRLRHTGRLADPPEQRLAWEEHGRTDRYLTLGEVRAACARSLPGARVRRHLLWRYSIVWRRPG
jgi:SAM-dependent methyltransferase